MHKAETDNKTLSLLFARELVKTRYGLRLSHIETLRNRQSKKSDCFVQHSKLVIRLANLSYGRIITKLYTWSTDRFLDAGSTPAVSTTRALERIGSLTSLALVFY